MQLHLGQTRRNGNQLADRRHQTAKEGGNDPVLAEIFLGMSHLFPIEQAKMPHPAVGELIDDRTP